MKPHGVAIGEDACGAGEHMAQVLDNRAAACLKRVRRQRVYEHVISRSLTIHTALDNLDTGTARPSAEPSATFLIGAPRRNPSNGNVTGTTTALGGALDNTT